METETNKNVFFLPFEVKPHEIDFHGLLSPYYFLVHIQEAAIQHGIALRMGFQDLREIGLFWVLTRMKSVITRYLETLERGVVATWVKRVGGLQVLRDFLVTDSGGQEIAKATSSWMLLDLQTHRPKSFKDVPRHMPAVSQEALYYSKALPRLTTPSIETPHTVRYSDVDVNYHVNNLKYLAWIFDLFSLGIYEKQQIVEIDVQFLKEAHYGETLQMALEEEQQSHGSFLASVERGRHAAKEQLLRARIQLNPRH
jgi:acyl-ACP thioesterase